MIGRHLARSRHRSLGTAALIAIVCAGLVYTAGAANLRLRRLQAASLLQVRLDAVGNSIHQQLHASIAAARRVARGEPFEGFAWRYADQSVQALSATPVAFLPIERSLARGDFDRRTENVLGPFQVEDGRKFIVLWGVSSAGTAMAAGVAVPLKHILLEAGIPALVARNVRVRVDWLGKGTLYGTGAAGEPVESGAARVSFELPGAAHWAITAAPASDGGQAQMGCAVLALLVGCAAGFSAFQLLQREEHWDVERTHLALRADRLDRSLTEVLRVSQQAEKHRLASSELDPTTGLLTRAAFCAELERQLVHTRATIGKGVCVLTVQVRLAHDIAAAYGGGSTQFIMAAAAARIDGLGRWRSPFARISETSLGAVLLDTSELNLQRLACELAEVLSPQYPYKGAALRGRFGVGFSVSPDGHIEAEELLTQANTASEDALYSETAYREYEPSVRAEAVTRLRFEEELREALQQNALQLHYQPVIAVATETLVGFEALLRWQHPHQGLLTPDVFLAAAENAGLLLEIDRWVMREAARQLQQWNAAYSRKAFISINVSAQRFMHPGLPGELAQLIYEHSIDPSQLHLEILERTLIEDTESARAMALQLRNLGVQLWLDDFGTAYSSLCYLRTLPVHALKVDRTFVSRMVEDTKDLGVVKTIIDLAHYLELKCVVEGVETVDQHQLLQMLGPDYCQGYFYSRPAIAAVAEHFLKEEFPLRRTA